VQVWGQNCGGRHESFLLSSNRAYVDPMGFTPAAVASWTENCTQPVHEALSFCTDSRRFRWGAAEHPAGEADPGSAAARRSEEQAQATGRPPDHLRRETDADRVGQAGGGSAEITGQAGAREEIYNPAYQS
jgi:hypothetical protein